MPIVDQYPEAVRNTLSTLTSGPGVYQMLAANGAVLYVGKARNLKRRVSSYFTRAVHDAKTQRMLQDVADVQVTRTANEGEALLLENNQIKEHKPPYNVMFRDDKSYPYLVISKHDYPRIYFYRGAKRKGERYFGPYPNAWAARRTITELQKLFQIRPCSDSYFRNRTRPCLQHQIHRCSAPCVNKLSVSAYAADLTNALRFLEGKNQEITDELGNQMEQAAERLEFERAAQLRDQLRILRRSEQSQHVSTGAGEVDVIACSVLPAAVCVSVGFVRHGRHLGHRNYFPKVPKDIELAELLAAFIPQYYADNPPPAEILLEAEIAEQAWLNDWLNERAGRQVSLKHRFRSERSQWMDMAKQTASQALAGHLAADVKVQQKLAALAVALKLDDTPKRIECFDISHSQGEQPVASCVVYDESGQKHSDYRKFNITDITAGDDYAAIHQAIERRYKRVKAGEAPMPDVLLIDGGKGQLSSAMEAIEALALDNPPFTLGVSKGADRKAGQERLFLWGQQSPLILPSDSMALLLIQEIRDEAHRFAITGHRKRRAKARNESGLESLPGVGPKRRQALLKHFGGLREVQRAGVIELSAVAGISKVMAQQIYEFLHPNAD